MRIETIMFAYVSLRRLAFASFIPSRLCIPLIFSLDGTCCAILPPATGLRRVLVPTPRRRKGHIHQWYRRASFFTAGGDVRGWRVGVLVAFHGYDDGQSSKRGAELYTLYWLASRVDHPSLFIFVCCSEFMVSLNLLFICFGAINILLCSNCYTIIESLYRMEYCQERILVT